MFIFSSKIFLRNAILELVKALSSTTSSIVCSFITQIILKPSFKIQISVLGATVQFKLRDNLVLRDGQNF